MVTRKTLCNKATARRNLAHYRCVLVALAASACFQLTAAELITNGGFESYTGTIPSAHYGNASESLYVHGWEGTYGLSSASSPFLEGGSGSPYEGSVAVHFNGVKEISQQVNVADAGLYEISFAYAPRNKAHYAGGRINVWIDDVKVGYVDCDAATIKFRRCMMRVRIAFGSHVFKLSHTLDHPVSANNTPCSVIDAVSIVEAEDDNLIANGGFESYIGTLSGIEAAFSDSFKVDTWKYDTGCGLATTNSNYLQYQKGSPFEGNVSYWFNNAHSVSQTVFVAESGDYDISFAYAPRHTQWYYNGRIRVFLDDEEVGEYADCDRATSKFRNHLFRTHVSAGLHVFMLKHTTENPADGSHVPCSAVDAVSFRAANTLLLNGNFDAGNVVANNGGYSGSTDSGYANPGWTTSGNCGLAKPGVPDNARLVSSSIDTGVYSMFILTANYNGRQNPPVSISQSFTAPKAGVYQLRFSYASRPYSQYKGGTIYARIYRGEGLEGAKVWERSVVATSLNAFQQFVGEAKLYSSGKYTLEFYAPQPEYIESGENNLNSVIDNVSLEYSRKIQGFMMIVR